MVHVVQQIRDPFDVFEARIVLNDVERQLNLRRDLELRELAPEAEFLAQRFLEPRDVELERRRADLAG